MKKKKYFIMNYFIWIYLFINNKKKEFHFDSFVVIQQTLRSPTIMLQAFSSFYHFLITFILVFTFSLFF